MRPNAADAYDEVAGDESVRRGGWVSSIVPQSLLVRSLSVAIDAPGTFVVERPTRFEFQVTNRLPMPVSVTLPTGRLWGWRVEGFEEADRRTFEPPREPRTLAFNHLETRTFTASWDGLIREAGDDGDRWVPATGERILTAYLATDPPLSDETVVTVEEP